MGVLFELFSDWLLTPSFARRRLDRALATFGEVVPIDAAVAFIGASRLRDAEKATRLSCAVWVTASLMWWRRSLPNAWGPPAGVGTFVFALAGSSMILTKFRVSRKPVE